MADHVNADERLLGVLADIARWLEPRPVEAAMFGDFLTVRKSSVALHVNNISFGAKAIQASTNGKPRQVRSIFRPTGISYDDYQALQRSIERNL